MFDHLLEPMGVLDRPSDLPAGVQAYVDVRESQERRHDVLVTRTLEGSTYGLDAKVERVSVTLATNYKARGLKPEPRRAQSVSA
jgi:hypothetical protein